MELKAKLKQMVLKKMIMTDYDYLILRMTCH